MALSINLTNNKLARASVEPAGDQYIIIHSESTEPAWKS